MAEYIERDAAIAKIRAEGTLSIGYHSDKEVEDDIVDMLERLPAYEDTEIEPEEIIAGKERAEIACALNLLKTYQALGNVEELSALVEAREDGRVVVLDMPRKPLVWGDDGHNTCLCPGCGEDLIGIPYGERLVLQCPACGQYLDITKIITREEAEKVLEEA